MSKYYKTRSRIEHGWHKHVSNYIFSCLQITITLHCAWHTSIQINNKAFIVFHSSRNRYKCKIIHMELSCVNGDIHCRISWKVLYYINMKNRISFSTYVHPRCPPLWKIMMCGIFWRVVNKNIREWISYNSLKLGISKYKNNKEKHYLMT